MKRLVLPPTRNHRQLATWINAEGLVDDQGRPVEAKVERFRTNTDRKFPGSRLRWPGKGRMGLLLEIWLAGFDRVSWNRLYRHESGETYRRHAEAREWVEKNLRAPRQRIHASGVAKDSMRMSLLAK